MMSLYLIHLNPDLLGLLSNYSCPGEVEPFIEFEERIFDVLSVARPQHGRVPSPFEGPPTPENNERWKNLTDRMLPLR